MKLMVPASTTSTLSGKRVAGSEHLDDARTDAVVAHERVADAHDQDAFCGLQFMHGPFVAAGVEAQWLSVADAVAARVVARSVALAGRERRLDG